MILRTVIQGFKKTSIKLEPDSARFVNHAIVTEYTNEFLGRTQW